jgi:hypothetical protein
MEAESIAIEIKRARLDISSAPIPYAFSADLQKVISP